jgi:hypothetical protein
VKITERENRWNKIRESKRKIEGRIQKHAVFVSMHAEPVL